MRENQKRKEGKNWQRAREKKLFKNWKKERKECIEGKRWKLEEIEK